jgi:actin-related protein
MFCDDVNGIAVHIGHIKSYIGFVGDETPSYQSDSFVRSDNGENFGASFEDLTRNLCPTSMINPLVENKRVNDIEVYGEFISKFAGKINTCLNEVGVFMSMHDHEGTAAERKQLSTLLFEKYDVPALFFGNKNVNSMFSSGKISGTLIDTGAYFTDIIPIVDGYAIKQGIIKSRK